MFLGEIISEYRRTHRISMDKFAEMSGLSKGYISMLEKNEHPKTKEPIIPSLPTFTKVASAIGMNLDDLIHMVEMVEEPQTSRSSHPWQPTLHRRDYREIGDILDTTRQLLQQDGLMFDGKPATDEDVQSILDAMQIGLEMAKKKNKERYTPKKYRK